MHGKALRARLSTYFLPDGLAAVFIIDEYLGSLDVSPLANSAKNPSSINVKQWASVVAHHIVLCWNILIDNAKGMQGVGNTGGRFKNIARVVHLSGADIVCLQEVTITSYAQLMLV